MLSLCNQQVSLCGLWYDQQLSVCYPCVISRCLFVDFDVISSYLCVILVQSAGVS